MPKITSVEPQKKNPHRFNVFLNGEFAFGADEDLVVENRLVVGKIIEPADLEKILFDAEVGKLMERVYGLFNIRQRSEKEIRDFLKRVSFKRKAKDDEEISLIVVESVVDRAKKKGLINDEQFARLWVEARSKKKGKQLIKQELFQKGISRDIIEEILTDSSHLSKESEQLTAEKILDKKIKIWQGLPYLQKKKKACDFLMRRGFEYETAKIVLEKLIKNS